MIARLSGILFEKHADRVVVDVGGVGYEVFVPFSTGYELGEPGESIKLEIYTHVKEDSLSLYGFLTGREKKLFTRLIQISGIGPKLANTILSGLPVEDLVRAVREGDLVRLNRIPGVGKKTAERILLELRDKAQDLPPESPVPGGVGGSVPLRGDLISALANLGYARNQAERAADEVIREGASGRFEELLRRALKRLVAP